MNEPNNIACLSAWDCADEELHKIIDEISKMPGVFAWEIRIAEDFVYGILRMQPDGEKTIEHIIMRCRERGKSDIANMVKLMDELRTYAKIEKLHVDQPMQFK